MRVYGKPRWSVGKGSPHIGSKARASSPASIAAAARYDHAGNPAAATDGACCLNNKSRAGTTIMDASYDPATKTFTGQVVIANRGSKFLNSGDSGSLMVTETGNNPVGLCFAGGSGGAFANPIGPVLQQFGVTVCGQ
jgi:hypothetical protein